MALYLCGRFGEDVTRRVTAAWRGLAIRGDRVVVECPNGHRSAFVEPPPDSGEENIDPPTE